MDRITICNRETLSGDDGVRCRLQFQNGLVSGEVVIRFRGNWPKPRLANMIIGSTTNHFTKKEVEALKRVALQAFKDAKAANTAREKEEKRAAKAQQLDLTFSA
jgi:hypothetical protein